MCFRHGGWVEKGDIIFSQSIAHHFIEQGHHILWPVKPHYVDACQRAYPKICFVSEVAIKPEYFNIKEKVELDGMLIAPIRWSDSYMKRPYREVMRNKYDMYNLSWEIWRLHAMWRRDADKENELMRQIGIVPGQPFNLINKRFGTNAERSVEININNEFKNIEMTEVPGYSLFDWSKIIQSAQEIHTVSTSLLFMLEVLPLTASSVHLYCRKPVEKDFSFVDYIFTKDYILHT